MRTAGKTPASRNNMIRQPLQRRLGARIDLDQSARSYAHQPKFTVRRQTRKVAAPWEPSRLKRGNTSRRGILAAKIATDSSEADAAEGLRHTNFLSFPR
jgi:hypothetical protein